MTLPELARISVETYLKEGKVFEDFSGLPKEFLDKKAGAFVSIFNKKSLRGCIGTYLATRENIAQEVVFNAMAASTEDYRFSPITKEDLPLLSFTVYVLGEPRLVKGFQELDPQKYGVIVSTMLNISGGVPPAIVKSGGKTGLLLPNLEDVDSVEKQIFIACQKAGINQKQEQIMIYKFEAEKYE